MTITLDVPPELEEELRAAARTQGKDVSSFLLDSARQRLRPDVLSEAESQILRRINAPIALEARSKRDALLALLEQRELTEEEQATLAALIDDVELANADHWQAIADLARLRGCSVADVARDLQITLP